MQKRIFSMLNSEEFNDLVNYYEHPTIFGILGVSRKEVVHSNFLGWLFDSRSSHTLGDYAIRKLLEVCYDYLPKNIQELVAMGNYEINNLNVSREIKTDNSGILDILIHLDLFTKSNNSEKLYIIIENKIESLEHDEQTFKYQQWWENNELKGENVLMLYLTPNLEEDLSSNRFIKVSYTDISNRILKYCKMKETNPIAKHLITDYICCLSQPSVSVGNRDDMTHTILAISDDVKEKVEKLINKYNEEIKYVINGLINRNDKFINNIYQSRVLTFKGIFYIMLEITNDRTLIDNINSIMFNKTKKIEFDNKKYQTYGRNHNSIGYLILSMIKKYAKDNDITFEELKSILNSKEWLSPWVDELISKSVPNVPEHFYMQEEDKVELKDCDIYVARYWIYDDVLKMAQLLNQNIKILNGYYNEKE